MGVFSYEKDGQIFWGYRKHVRFGDRRTQREKQLGCKTKGEAEKQARKLERIWTEELAQKCFQGVTWESLVEKWELALRDGSALDEPLQITTIEDRVRVLQLYTKDWYHLPAAEITTGDVNRVIKRMAAETKSVSRQKALKCAINSLFKWAIECRMLKGVYQSPAIGVSLKRADMEARKPPILTLSEMRKFLESAREIGHKFYHIWACAFHTGARSGELIGLKWSCVDFENRMVLIQTTYNRRLNSFTPTKGGYWREIPMNDQLYSLLNDLRVMKVNGDYVFPHYTEWLRGEGARITRAFCLGIGIPQINFHATRACFATQLIKAGVAPAVVMKIGGWTELKVMQKYIRMAGIEIQGATDRLDLISPRAAMGKVVELFGQRT